MKVKVHESKPGFAPVELSLRIETEQELLDLWHRLHLTTPQIKLGKGAKFHGGKLTAFSMAIDDAKESRKIDAYSPVEPDQECPDCGEVHKEISLKDVLIKMAKESQERKATRDGEL